MKKITFFTTTLMLCLATNSLHAQTYSTGEVNLTPGQTAQIDITPSEVTLTMTGQDDRWLGLGFNATSMTAGTDAVIFDGTNLTDREIAGFSTPPLDASQDWSIVSNTTSGGTRTIVATRSLTGDGVDDYEFTAETGSIDLIYSNGNGPTFNLGYHGGGTTNRGMVPGNSITLSNDDFEQEPSFTISPNPARERMNIELNPRIQNARLQVYDVLGKRIIDRRISDIDASINVSSWNSGVYIVRLASGDSFETKRFVKQ